ncbi:MAG: ABC transporter ATP-binding protein [Planctomycetes bacterium]|nr:ABC transporter ATP-binding protein [Planctomycetota bacterium]MBI3847998.1 ABC transporter ATP-binding protein [Planctomycetota bacterium]
MKNEVILKAVDIHHVYVVGREELHVLRGANLEVRSGEILAITGASGTGKSTLLHLLGLLDTPKSGQILFHGKDLCQLRDEERSLIRNRQFGFVFQFYHLLPELTAVENAMLPAMIGVGSGEWSAKKGRARDRARDLLRRVGLSGRESHRPSQLSGGERQRVAVARALMNEPSVVLCDEPTGNLDARTSRGIYELIEELNRTMGVTFVVVTHEADLARRANRIVRIVDGAIVDANVQDMSE